jgi:hypothetical protein
MTTEAIRGKPERSREAELLIRAFHTPFVEAISRTQFHRAGLLSELER